MYRLFPCTKDTYVVNRIVSNTRRATDANVGHAGTLDLFKLYDESVISGSTQPTELSRLLVKFDLNKIRALTGSIVDIADSSFKVTMRLSDVVGGQPTPSNFTVSVHPLSMSWDEGIGHDVGRYADLGAANWVTASTSTGIIAWNSAGAGASGGLGGINIDIIASGNLNDGQGLRALYKTQTFDVGDEDLELDVTDIVSATLKGAIPDHGFRIAFTDTHELSSSSLFVKRFASRHASNPLLRPTLVMKFDESIRDNHANFIFDVSGSLFLFNTVRGQLTNFVSGASASQITGSDSMRLKLISGAIAPVTSQSFAMTYSVDQFSYGSNFVSGTYVSNFAVSSFDSSLVNEVNKVGSASFHTIWGSIDGTVPFYTGSLVIRRSFTSSKIAQDRTLSVTMPNHRQVYRKASSPRIRVNVFDTSANVNIRPTRVPLRQAGIVTESMYWRLVDTYTGDVVIPFDTVNNSTRLSTDADGMYFDFYPEDLNLGRVYGFEFLIVDGGEDIIIDKNLPTFRIES
jgi:hypothetical protein